MIKEALTVFSIGLMSGTSMDGIDAALVKTDGIHHIEEVANASLSYDKAFHHALKAAEYSVRKHKENLEKAEETYAADAREYCQEFLKLSPDQTAKVISSIQTYFGGKFPTLYEVIQHSTDLHGDLVEALLGKAQMAPENVKVIGYHGQTLYHAPQEKITIQVGDGQRLAERIGIPVVYQFRKNDVENGGQGAPFAPLYHQALAIRDHLAPVAIVNCGGISNVTFVFGPGDSDVMGFDTGPGNGLVDLYIKRTTQGRETYDADGKYGSTGNLNATLRDELFNSLEGFLHKNPPKSLDIAGFSLPASVTAMSMSDVVRTLEEFTAETILSSLNFIPKGKPLPHLWVVAGGGWKNPIILKSFEAHLSRNIPGTRVVSTDDIGWTSDALEAQIFAYLAVRSLKNLPLSLPTTTGVAQPMVGGILANPTGLQRSQQKK